MGYVRRQLQVSRPSVKVDTNRRLLLSDTIKKTTANKIMLGYIFPLIINISFYEAVIMLPWRRGMYYIILKNYAKMSKYTERIELGKSKIFTVNMLATLKDLLVCRLYIIIVQVNNILKEL